MEWKRRKKSWMQAVKIAIGSSVAIYVADLFHLQFAASAGSIALLTIVATKWETVKLSYLRVFTFCLAVLLSWITIQIFQSEWVAYGMYIFLLLMICEPLGWKSTVSVNAVIGTHFLTVRDFSSEFIVNEFWLVLIGISLAVVLNLFHDNKGSKEQLIRDMRFTEEKLQEILRGVASYLSNRQIHGEVWKNIEELNHRLHEFLSDACAYQGNTFQSHPVYYIDYFEMRMKQCGLLANLHNEMRKIRKIPGQAAIVAEYLIYMSDYVVERNIPEEQIQRLEGIFDTLRTEPLPASREEFENRAILYHILMDIEEFLLFKKQFVEEMDEEQKNRYWNKEIINLKEQNH